MPTLVVNLLAGLLFGLGLAMSGMTHPEKVLGFLDFAGHWDASLLFVLGGAVGVTVIAFRFVLRQPKPLLAQIFHLSTKTRIDLPLVAGAVIFGIGWGISGYCPGPAVALLAVPDNREVWLFLPALLAGQWLHRTVERIDDGPQDDGTVGGNDKVLMDAPRLSANISSSNLADVSSRGV
jgi:uncharacterized membrane protein YedE/YeeE